MHSTKVTFENRNGDRLSARIDLPVDGEPEGYALFAHCFTCSKNLKSVGNICRALTRERIGVLRFDFTGLGESEGEFADTNFSTNVSDLEDAAAFLDGWNLQTPDDIVAFFDEVFYQRTLPEDNRNLLLQYLTTDENGDPKPLDPADAEDFQRGVRELVGLMLSLPQWHYQ